jgi:UDP:flavonoid glycosyltransferase YjiC (YdhE family)
MNRVRKEFGIEPLPADLRVMYTEGSYVLYPDIPEFVPASNLPTNHRYVGICQWTPPTAKPDWWDRMLEDPKPKVFISLGSSGPLRALPALLEALSKLPVAVLIATSGRTMPRLRPGAYVADLLPFTETARQARVVVSHGGSGGLYPAIAAWNRRYWAYPATQTSSSRQPCSKRVVRDSECASKKLPKGGCLRH